ncbi:hypothetical protein COV93_02880 [Candidatus Woesearchaeota archaeon CG11_big_fil_rev_8_21_14_0_20_43_8]|nr:MAG: hypothetical protein COV93_02880 [Candidatus Woesearchaeota archaeon CG11_big_fil_rev_8_21_14_0_20_43_8]PIO04790.1 MAG: hypothetical protein COT47_07505 [Candidatus Woesearchaeota archaeon CG08_land_8_20_14_0_20_43_7]
MVKKFLILIVLLLIPVVYASETLKKEDWYDTSKNYTVDSLGFRVIFSSGDVELVQVKLLDDRLLVPLSDCKTLGSYKFCFDDTRFDPHEGQGTIDYGTDKEYHQVHLKIYKNEVDIIDLGVDHLFSKESVIIGDPISVKVTITNNNDVALYDVKVVETIPDSFVIQSFAGSSRIGDKIQWTGKLEKGGTAIFSYNLIGTKEFSGKINCTSYLDNKTVQYSTKIDVKDPSDFLKVTPIWIQNTIDQFEEGTFSFDVLNAMNDSDTESRLAIDMQLKIPESMRLTSRTLSTGGRGVLTEKASLGQGEKITHSIRFRPDYPGVMKMELSVDAIINQAKARYDKNITVIVPSEGISILQQRSKITYVPGDDGWINLSIWNRDKTNDFNDVDVIVISNDTVIKVIKHTPFNIIKSDEKLYLAYVGFTVPNRSTTIAVNLTFKSSKGMKFSEEKIFTIYSPESNNSVMTASWDIGVVNSSKQSNLTIANTSSTIDTKAGKKTVTVTDKMDDPVQIMNLRWVLIGGALIIIMFFAVLGWMKWKKPGYKPLSDIDVDDVEINSLADNDIGSKEEISDDNIKKSQKRTSLDPPKKGK